jgi:hypothetical protein
MLITTRARKTTATFVGLALATTLALSACSNDTEETPKPTSSSSATATPAPSGDASTSTDPDAEVSTELPPEPQPVEADPENLNQFDIDFSQIEIPAELTEGYGEELANKFAPDAANIVSIFRNENAGNFVGPRTGEFDEQNLELLRPYMTDAGFELLAGSFLGRNDTGAYASLLASTDAEGKVYFSDEEVYTVDPNGPGIVTSLPENPVVQWLVQDNGAEIPIIDFTVQTTYFFEEGTFVMDGIQRLALVPDGDNNWVVDGWLYERTGLTQS